VAKTLLLVGVGHLIVLRAMLQRWRPQSRALAIIGDGNQCAVATRNGITLGAPGCGHRRTGSTGGSTAAPGLDGRAIRAMLPPSAALGLWIRTETMTMNDTTERGMVIVTGGSRGIGAAICRKLAADGYAVAVNYATQPDAAASVVADIVAAGGRAKAFPADVSSESDVRTLFTEAQAALGPLVGLVNNAGILGGSTRVEALTVEALNRTLAINVVGTVLCAREAINILSTRHGGKGGAIVNLGSVATRLGGPGELVHYATSKGAIDTFTLGLAREVADEGIRVNAVAPGLIDTEMNSAERQARISPNIPIKRPGTAPEIAEAVAWLLSPAASYVTGSILTVSGGR